MLWICVRHDKLFSLVNNIARVNTTETHRTKSFITHGFLSVLKSLEPLAPEVGWEVLKLNIMRMLSNCTFWGQFCGCSFTEIQKLLLQIINKKADLLRRAEAQDQYEKLLQQYGEFLATAANKLKPEEISAVNLPALKQQAQDHKVPNRTTCPFVSFRDSIS